MKVKIVQTEFPYLFEKNTMYVKILCFPVTQETLAKAIDKINSMVENFNKGD